MRFRTSTGQRDDGKYCNVNTHATQEGFMQAPKVRAPPLIIFASRTHSQLQQVGFPRAFLPLFSFSLSSSCWSACVSFLPFFPCEKMHNFLRKKCASLFLHPIDPIPQNSPNLILLPVACSPIPGPPRAQTHRVQSPGHPACLPPAHVRAPPRITHRGDPAAAVRVQAGRQGIGLREDSRGVIS